MFFRLLGDFVQDLLHGLRQLRRSPGFTLIAVLTLALGIGANTAIFSLVDTVMFKPMGPRDESELVQVGTRTLSRRFGGFSYNDYLQIARDTKAFSAVSIVLRRAFPVTENGRVTMVFGQTVSANYFDTVGVPAAAGRGFLPSDGAPGATPVVVLSDGYWKRRYGGDHSAIGSYINLGNRTATVIGVAPPRFQGTTMVGSELWLAAQQDAEASQRNYEMIGRLRPGASLDQAQAEMQRFTVAMGQATPGPEKITGAVVSREGFEGKRTLLGSIPLILAAFVLLIACATLENLMLSRAESRAAEFAIRTSLGAERMRLVRQLLTEGFLLSLAGAALGLLVAAWVLRLFPSLLPSVGARLPYEFGIDVRVVAFAAVACVATTLLFGLGPAFYSSRRTLFSTLKGGQAAPLLGFKNLAGRNLLVAGQVAASVVLVVCSGLLVRSLLNLNRLDLGFEKKPMLVLMVINPSRSPAEAAAFEQELLARASAVPGVVRATCTSRVPLSTMGGGARQQVFVPGLPLPPGEETVPVSFSSVGAGYFQTMGTRILLGRAFDARDTAQSPRVAIVNSTMARQFWNGRDPVGHTFYTGGANGVQWQVIGVTQDGKYNSVTEAPKPYAFFPLSQMPRSEVTLLAQTSIDPAAVRDVLVREVRAINPAVVTMDAITATDHVRTAVWLEDTAAKLVSIFGALALLLSSLGLSGVVGYSISRRTREIGVRMALGASRWAVLRQVLRNGMGLALGGTAAGVLLAAGIARLLAWFLYGVNPFDPLIFAGACLLIVFVALASCFLPAYRASRVDPAVALRYE